MIRNVKGKSRAPELGRLTVLEVHLVDVGYLQHLVGESLLLVLLYVLMSPAYPDETRRQSNHITQKVSHLLCLSTNITLRAVRLVSLSSVPTIGSRLDRADVRPLTRNAGINQSHYPSTLVWTTVRFVSCQPTPVKWPRSATPPAITPSIRGG